MNTFSKNLMVWLIVIAVMFAAFNLFKPMENAVKKNYSDVWQAVEKGEITTVVIDNQKITANNKSGEKWVTYRTFDQDLLPILRANNVNIDVSPPTSNFLYSFLGGIIQIVIIVAIWLFLMRQMQGGGKAMTFGKSKAKLLNEDQKKVTFEDVAGIDEAKYELEEIIDFLTNPRKFVRLGGRIPRGVLLMGPPGTGKTLLAKAIAGEAGVPFFSISGSEFVEMFVGVGASRVRDMFAQGKKSAPCILFIDEIDAVGRHRGAGLGGGHDEREQTLNQLLVEMDGFETNEGLIVVAATNRPDVLDPALLRPGRFDRQVVVPVPDVRGREAILKVHVKKVPLDKAVDLQVIARGTPGFSGADLANLVNEAALMAARTNKDTVDNASLEAARDKLVMGVERKSLIMSEAEKLITAWHEAGHALVGALLPEADPVHKVSIIPRGFALGVTQFLPAEEKYNFSYTHLQTHLVMLLGGRTAEEIALKEITTGASNDIERATTMARNMVCKWGMSSLGPLAFGSNEGEQVFLGKSLGQSRNYSEETAKKIDVEVNNLIVAAHDKATGLLTKHFKTLEVLTNTLLEKETIDGPDAFNICLEAMREEGVDLDKKKISFAFTDKKEVSQKDKEDKETASEDKTANSTDSDDLKH